MNFHENVVREVLALATENPDCIYHGDTQGCCYVYGECSNGSTGCIVGQAIRRLGVDTSPIAAGVVGQLSANDAIRELGYDSQEPVRDSCDEWLNDVQDAQDRGNTWSEAVEYANSFR